MDWMAAVAAIVKFLRETNTIKYTLWLIIGFAVYKLVMRAIEVYGSKSKQGSKNG